MEGIVANTSPRYVQIVVERYTGGRETGTPNRTALRSGILGNLTSLMICTLLGPRCHSRIRVATTTKLKLMYELCLFPLLKAVVSLTLQLHRSIASSAPSPVLH